MELEPQANNWPGVGFQAGPGVGSPVMASLVRRLAHDHSRLVLRRKSAMDCLIIGGGPAGLTTASSLPRSTPHPGRGRRGKSRCLDPDLHNLGQLPEGISGGELLARMRTQAERYGARIVSSRIERLDKVGERFTAVMADGRCVEADRVLLTTGAEDIAPPLALPDREEGVRRGLLRSARYAMPTRSEGEGWRSPVTGPAACTRPCCCGPIRPT